MKFKRYRHLLVLFALLLLCAVVLTLGGCQEKASDKNTADTTQQESEAADISTDIVLASDGSSAFTVWIAEEHHSEGTVRDAVDKLVREIEKKTGAELRVRKDILATDEERKAPAILIGDTAFSESEELLLKNKDRAIFYVNNKIVLRAPDKEAVIELVQMLLTRVIEPQTAEDRTLYFSVEKDSYLESGSYRIGSVLCCGVELIQYRIVIPANANVNERVLANSLRNHLLNSYGFAFEIVSDTEPEATYEILIGDTARTTQTADNGCFLVFAKDGKLEITAADMRGYEGLYEYVKKTLFKAGRATNYEYTDGYRVSKKTENSLSNGTLFADTSYGDIRVMFYNIYSGSNNNATPAVRIPYQKEILATYQPDVFGLQEYKAARHGELASYALQLGYVEVPNERGNANWTPMFYQKDRLTLLRSGHLLYSGTDDATKGVTWAVFVDTTTGKLLAVFNTHMMYNRNGADLTEIRVSNARELTELIASIQSQYPDVTVVMGGDLNSKTDSTPHGVLRSAKLVSAHGKASHKNDNSGHHAYPLYDTALQMFIEWNTVTPGYANAIDHVYVSSNAKVKSFAFLVHYYTLWASDHMPMLVEIDLK